MAEAFVGEVRLFGFNFPPPGWATCDGGLLSIQDNQVLFQLVGTTYGGDGQTTFAVPDLRGRLPVHQGPRPGGATRTIGELGGSERAQLTGANLPPHTHGVGTSSPATTNRPGLPARGGSYAPSGADGSSTTSVGGGAAIETADPYVVGNFCICVQGIYPPPT